MFPEAGENLTPESLYHIAHPRGELYYPPRVCRLLIGKTPPDTLSSPDIFRDSLCLCALQILNIIDLYSRPFITFLIPIFSPLTPIAASPLISTEKTTGEPTLMIDPPVVSNGA